MRMDRSRGHTAAEWLAVACDRETPGGGSLPAELLNHGHGAIAGIPVVIARVDWAGPGGFLVRVAAADRQRLATHLRSTGVVEAGREAAEVVRIEEGRPEAVDIPEKTLPQELGRDARAISFTKGCYLGQETVARIDALGHVNRRLVAVAVDGPVAVGPRCDRPAKRSARSRRPVTRRVSAQASASRSR